MTEHDYPIVLRALTEEEGGGFMAIAPDLQGCYADGETEAEAVAQIRSAIGEWIDEANRLSRDVPRPGSCASQARERKAEIDQLIKAQEDLIKTQHKLVKSQRAEIQRIRESVSHLIDHNPKDDRSYMVWSTESASSPFIGAFTRNRHRSLVN